MGNGINLDLTKSIADLDRLLDEAIGEVSSRKLSVPPELYNLDVWRFQIGKHVQVIDDDGSDDEEDFPIFWIGYGWEENDKREPCLWIEFDAEMCPTIHWDKLHKLVGTSGKYHAEVTFEFYQPERKAHLHFILKEEYLKQFFGENTDRNAQKKILIGFINEVMEKL